MLGYVVSNHPFVFMGPGVAYWLRRCTTNQTVPGSIHSGVTWDFFRGSYWQNHVPWGRLSLWKWVPGISPGVKADSAVGWRPPTLVVPKVEKIQGLNLPRTPRVTSACRRILLLYFTFLFMPPTCINLDMGTASKYSQLVDLSSRILPLMGKNRQKSKKCVTILWYSIFSNKTCYKLHLVLCVWWAVIKFYVLSWP
jgi:hypothetical protein